MPARRGPTAKPRLPSAHARHTVTFTRGPQALQRALLGPTTPRYPPMPAWWKARYPIGSLPEWTIFWAHSRLGLREGPDWDYIKNVPAPQISGRMQLDFIEYDVRIVLEIQGTFWHYRRGSAQIANDLAERTRLPQRGYTLILLDEPDCLADPVFFLREARAGRDHSRLVRGKPGPR